MNGNTHLLLKGGRAGLLGIRAEEIKQALVKHGQQQASELATDILLGSMQELLDVTHACDSFIVGSERLRNTCAGRAILQGKMFILMQTKGFMPVLAILQAANDPSSICIGHHVLIDTIDTIGCLRGVPMLCVIVELFGEFKVFRVPMTLGECSLYLTV